MTLRNRVLVLSVIVSAITYLDRVCISAAAPAMMAELELTDMQMGYVFSVFALAYGVFEVPMGWLGDRIGQRKMLTRIVLCWSAFTALTGVVRSYWSLIAIRFAFGAAEAGAFPSIARALAIWFHATDRGRVTGIMWMGARFGGAIAPPLAALCIAWIGWRPTFWVFGAVGVIWCAFFWKLFRDNPLKHPAANAEDLKYARAHSEVSDAGEPVHVPWTRMFSSGNMWALFWVYFATSYGFWFLLTWLPTYLIREHGLSAQRAGFYAGLPLAIGAVSCVAGGSLSDWLVRRTGSLILGRRLVGIGGYLLTAAGFLAASMADSAFTAIAGLMVAEAGLDLAVPVVWACCLEAGGRFGGTATGFMNTASSISAFISPLAAAWLFAKYGSFDAMLASAALVYLLSSVIWFKINPAECLLPPDKA